MAESCIYYKSMILFLVCAGVTSIALGQTNPNVTMPSSPVVTGKVAVIRPLPEKKFFVVKVSRTTTNYNSNSQVKVWMEYTDNVPVLKMGRHCTYHKKYHEIYKWFN